MEKIPAGTPKTRTNLPFIIAVILALFILAAAFIGSFAFSFVKSKIVNKTANNIADLKKFGGALGNLPAGSTVKTKEEGIAVCKKSGVDYCWPLVALSFNDMGVCKLAPDPKACEKGAEEFKKDFEGGNGGAGGTPAAEVTSPPGGGQQDEELKKCTKGTWAYMGSAGKVAITGKENITVEGSRYEICCWEITSNDGAEPGKGCQITDQPDSIVIYRYVENKFVLESVALLKDGKSCTYIFDEDGTIANKMCQ